MIPGNTGARVRSLTCHVGGLLQVVRAAFPIELEALLAVLGSPEILPGAGRLQSLLLDLDGVLEAANLGVSRGERLERSRVLVAGGLSRPLCPLDGLGTVPDGRVRMGRQEPCKGPCSRYQARIGAERRAKVECCARASF